MIYALMSEELYHYGVKGMKWGVRHDKTRDSLSNRIKKRHAEWKTSSKYDYKKSNRYKQASSYSKAAQTRMYNVDNAIYGKRGANRIAYAVNEKGELRYKAGRKELARQLATGAAIVGVGLAGRAIVNRYLTNLGKVKAANYIAREVGNAYGLNTVRGGFTLNANSQIRRGAKILKAFGLA